MPRPANDPPMTAAVAHKPGAIRLDDYPLLVHAPDQHGPGVRTEDGKATVAEVAEAARSEPDRARVAARLGTTEAHVADALRYAAANPPTRE